MNSSNDSQARPRFFNSKKSDQPQQTQSSDQPSSHTSTSITQPAAPLNEPKVLSPIQEKEEPQQEERKHEVKQDDLKEASLAKHLMHQNELPQYAVQDGEFKNYPEITQKTVDKLKSRGITSLFPIQQHCFYPIYKREDIIARDLTGSGKTLGFGLPLVEYLRKNQLLGQRKIQAIVLAPTRELALQVKLFLQFQLPQVQNEFAKLKHYDNEFNTLTVYGGVSIDDQTRELRRGIDIFVGTTGRVLDHIQRGNIDFSAIKTIILDEADQMLKLGFKEDVEEILRIIREQCKHDLQICLFSATIPYWVKQVAKSHLKKNYRVVDLAENLKNKTAKLVQHLAINVHQSNLISALADLCDGRAIVFTQTKADANQLILSDKIKLDIEVMHGDIAQNQREVTLQRFREGKFNVLVATDVASRGLDIPNVDLVIQVEPPNDVETYIHRSGRTARAGKEGTCITFYDKRNQSMISQIETQAGIKFKNIGVPQPEDVIRASSKVMLKTLDTVNKDVLPLFKEAAQTLISSSGGDPEKALCKALAYISGYYKTAMQSKSLITGQERQMTMEMKFEQKQQNPVRLAAELLHQHYPSNLSDNVRGIKARADSMGVVFDIFSDLSERFLEIGAHLKQTDSSIDFEISRCCELPQLEDDGSKGAAWRSGQGSGSFTKHGRHQSFNLNGDSSWGGGQSSTFKPSGRGGAEGGFHSRQPSGTNQGWANNGPKSYNNSRKASNFSNWDQQSNGGSEAFDDNQSFNDIDVKINHGSYTQGGHQTFKQQSFSQNQQQNLQEKTKVFLSSIHFSVREEDLRDLFNDYNLKVVKLNILKNEKGQSKGTGFVEFENSKDATSAVNKLNGFQFSGRPMALEFAKSYTGGKGGVGGGSSSNLYGNQKY